MQRLDASLASCSSSEATVRSWQRAFFFVCVYATCTAQVAHRRPVSYPPDKPRPFVESLYGEVIASPPTGIPSGKDLKRFRPFMSTALLRRTDLLLACEKDWDRQQPRGVILKAPFSVFESGIFSGRDERTEPGSVRVVSIKEDRRGTYQAEVELSYRPPDVGTWRVVVSLLRQQRHLVVDDVSYLYGENMPAERLTQSLSAGCNGSHWIGYERSLPRQSTANHNATNYK